MYSVFDFLSEFRTLLRGAGIRFAITSGMAYVRYGLQQLTKDSDWHWLTIEPFAKQHARLVDAAERHGLAQDPLSAAGTRERAYTSGIERAAGLNTTS